MDQTRSDIADENKTITAIFSNKLTAEYLSTEGGYVLGSVYQELEQGEKTSEVTAVAISGYTFVGWSDGNKKATRSDFVMESFCFTAIFKRLYTLELSCDTSRGEIEGTLVQKVAEGESALTVTAKPKDGYDFVCWSNGETSVQASFTVTKNEKITAYFVPKSSGLSVVTIDTETGNDVTSKETYIGCTITVYDKVGNYHVTEQSAQIRGRGNSTWTQKFGKKPYKIKFDSKQDVFGFGKAKDWVLLADYIDKSLLRNNLAYTVGGALSELESSPDCRAVEVYLNGSYHGVYLLCEQVEINDSRVENPWFKALLAHEEFRELVAKELYENEDIIRETIEAELDKAYEAQDAYEKNFERWQVMGVNTWTNPSYIVAITTWEGQVEYCRDYLDKSLDYLIETYPYTPPSESE